MDRSKNLQPELNVFFAIGRFFIPYFSVAVTSLLENNKNLNIKVFLIHDFKEIELLNELIQFLNSRFGISLNLIYQDIKIFQHYKVGQHVSLNTYLRLLLPDLIPDDIESGLFLDSDVVVTGSLIELTKITFSDTTFNCQTNSSAFLYAVREAEEQNEANSQRLSSMGYPSNSYFNAGVLMINLKQWRQKNVSADLLQLAGSYMDKLVFWDQDILNMYFLNRWGQLEDTYNALHLFRMKRRTPLVIHYSGSSKPWNYCNQHPYKRLYFKYWKLLPFRGNRYTDFRITDIPYKLYRDLRHLLGYIRNINATILNINLKK